MNDTVVLQYAGFKTKGAVREYTFKRSGTDGASSEYSVTNANDAFVPHRVRYQDAPDICSRRLRREFAIRTDYPLSARFSIADAELADYQQAHAPSPKPAYTHRRDQES